MKRLILFAPALLLTAAGQGERDGTIQPGQWETTVHFPRVEVTGRPDLSEQMSRDSQPSTQARCITPAEAANPTGGMLGGSRLNCRFDPVVFSGGRIHAEGICPGAGGNGEIHISWEGSYTDTTMDGAITSHVTGSEPELRMTGTIRARRVGDCTD